MCRRICPARKLQEYREARLAYIINSVRDLELYDYKTAREIPRNIVKMDRRIRQFEMFNFKCEICTQICTKLKR